MCQFTEPPIQHVTLNLLVWFIWIKFCSCPCMFTILESSNVIQKMSCAWCWNKEKWNWQEENRMTLINFTNTVTYSFHYRCKIHTKYMDELFAVHNEHSMKLQCSEILLQLVSANNMTSHQYTLLLNWISFYQNLAII